jgi:hypothetical protein
VVGVHVRHDDRVDLREVGGSAELAEDAVADVHEERRRALAHEVPAARSADVSERRALAEDRDAHGRNVTVR